MASRGAHRRSGNRRSGSRWPVVASAGAVLVLVAVGVRLLPGAGAAWISGAGGDPSPAAASTTDPSTSSPAASAPVPSTTAAVPSPTGPPPFDRTQFSIDDPSSIWVVVDKLRPSDPLDFAPDDLVDVGGGHQLRAEAAAALDRMFDDAAAAGLDLDVDSAYRSYVYQRNTFASGVARLGEQQALRGIARPGFSEHQTGLAADIGGGGCQIEACFADTDEGRWVAENGHRYGFVIRYPEGLESVTGYRYEPWHVRYVGVQLATEMRGRDVPTLEQFFELPPAPDYAA